MVKLVRTSKGYFKQYTAKTEKDYTRKYFFKKFLDTYEMPMIIKILIGLRLN